MHSSLLYSACHLFPENHSQLSANDRGTSSNGLPGEKKRAEKVAFDFLRQRTVIK
jgi:hypothetical protein